MYSYITIYVPGPLITIFFLRARGNLKHFQKSTCQNPDSESLRNAQKTMPTLKKKTNLMSSQDRMDLF